MKVLQLIDSLHPGGAEKMAVTYANALAQRIESSFLCCTRVEGLLKSQLLPEVGYLFLNKKNTLDPKAFLKLNRFVKEKGITLIHAHGSSWFLALLVKGNQTNVKLVWHDHWGERAYKNLPPGILRPASKYFEGILSVNPDLEKWARTNLKSSNIKCISNFIPLKKLEKEKSGDGISVLRGDPNSFKILCLANLRPPKDHRTLLRSFKLVVKDFPDTSLHLVGKDKNDSYSKDLKRYVKINGLQDKVFFYGEQGDVDGFLLQAEMGVLSSKTEGLPVALLEYGIYRLPIVCTRVGECEELVKNCGISVPPEESESFSKAVTRYLSDGQLQKEHSLSFYRKVVNNFSETKIIDEVITFYTKIEKE